MKSRTASRLAWMFFAIAALLTALALGANLFLPHSPHETGSLINSAFVDLALLAFPAVGAIVASRHPSNAVGWIFLVGGLVWSAQAAILRYGIYALFTNPGSLPGGEVAAWAATWLLGPSFFVFALLFLTFPDGKVLSRRWRAVVWLVGIGAISLTLATALGPGNLQEQFQSIPNPFGIEGAADLMEALANLGWLLWTTTTVAAAVSLVLRYRRSEKEQRQQLKWFASAGVLLALDFLFFGFSEGPTWNLELLRRIAEVLFLVAIPAVPVAAGVAILKYRLYDIDVVINRALVYGALAAFITAAYLALVIGIGAVVGSRTILSIIATAVIAVAFQPIRQRVQAFANRLVYGQRVTPYEAMAELSHQISGAISLDEVLPRMARTAAEGVGAARSRVRVFLPDGEERAAWWPGQAMDSFDRRVPVTHLRESIGEIAVTKPSGESLTTAEEKLLSDLASQAGLALRNVRLTEDLRASRRRIVTAQDEERRRMERDIHDGAQQQLVSLAIKLGLAKTLVSKAPEQASDLLDGLKGETEEALETLRDLARGLFPQILVDSGIGAAVQAHIVKMQIPAAIEDRLAGTRLDLNVEANVYFCIREALQNSSKHAPRSPIRVTLKAEDGFLSFSIRDEGPGFDPSKVELGRGLHNMKDRIEALGGDLKIDSSQGIGTTVTGLVPTSS